ncbi:MAG: FAD-binding oxidoreductase [Pseudomonadota bacterium]|nr:FAD-binding oxidoreductase [Pseudomonadota bacterium]
MGNSVRPLASPWIGVEQGDLRPHPQIAEIGTIVIGGGIVGLTTALFLAEEGVDVAVVDNDTLSGSSSNAGSLHVQMQSRSIRLFPHLVESLEWALPLYPLAVQHWRNLETNLGQQIGLAISGGLMVAEEEAHLKFLERKCRREKQLGLDVTTIDRAEIGRIAPYLGPSVIGAEFCATEGKVNPLRANCAVRCAAIDRGAVMLRDTNVARLDRSHNIFRVTTSMGVIRTGRVVLAAGIGTRALAAGLGIDIPVIGESLQMIVTEAVAPLISHLVQHGDQQITLKQLGNGQVIIGGGWPADHDGGNRPPDVRRDSLIGNMSLAMRLVPALADARLIRSWGGINPTLDGRAALGEVSAVSGLFIAIPGDAGYSLGPLCARLVVESMLGRRPEVDLESYSPSRFSGDYSGMISGRR